MKGVDGSRKQGGASPCAACKLLRRRCGGEECIFAPYFPADQPYKFAIVHKVFGASNVNKMLQELPIHQRGDAVSSMVYEANARVRDPVYGCVGTISSLQREVDVLQTQLALAQAEALHLRMCYDVASACQSNKGEPPLSRIMDSQAQSMFDVDTMMDQAYDDSLV